VHTGGGSLAGKFQKKTRKKNIRYLVHLNEGGPGGKKERGIRSRWWGGKRKDRIPFDQEKNRGCQLTSSTEKSLNWQEPPRGGGEKSTQRTVHQEGEGVIGNVHHNMQVSSGRKNRKETREKPRAGERRVGKRFGEEKIATKLRGSGSYSKN